MTTPSAPLLTARGLTAGYGNRRVLTAAALTVRPRHRLALLGANGSGKTTLLRCLSGAHRPDAGQIERDGTMLRYDRASLRAHRRRVQLVLQDPDDQLFSADVTQDISFGPLNLGLDVESVRARVTEAMELLSISHLADRPTHHLSYGERKRVATAGAVAMRPAVLLLDEPTAGLDPAGVAEVMSTLERLRSAGTTVVVSTHDMDLAAAWADEVGVVVDGGVRQGPTLDVLTDAELLARARLHRPWPLELALRLGLPERPRDLPETVTALGRHLPPTPTAIQEDS